MCVNKYGGHKTVSFVLQLILFYFNDFQCLFAQEENVNNLQKLSFWAAKCDGNSNNMSAVEKVYTDKKISRLKKLLRSIVENLETPR